MRRPTPRGFTLIELMISGAIAVIVLAGVCLAFISQAELYRKQVGRQEAQQNAREAVTYMEELIRNAGFGVDPDRVFLAYDGFDPANPGASSPNFPDAFTLHVRDLDFRRGVTAVSPTTLSLDRGLTQPLHLGQILLVLCEGASDWAYVTVGAPASAGDTSVTLDASAPTESPIGMPGPRFHQQDRLTAASCFNAGNAVLAKIDRYSFFVNAYHDDPNDPTTLTPYLMIHRGVDLNGDGAVDLTDATPLAAGVEQMQVAWVLNTTETAVAGCPVDPPILGVNAADVPYGDAWASNAPGPSLSTPYDSPLRCANHPANIRQVRVTVVARSKRDPKSPGDSPLSSSATATALDDGTLPWKPAENLDVNAAPAAFKPVGGGYLRTAMRIAVTPRNLLMRSQFVPLEKGGG